MIVCVAYMSVFVFPLDVGVWRLPAMALGRMRGYVTKKKKKNIDDLMMVHTVKSNLLKGYFKSTHTLGKKL